jgi:hypothetical protein
MADDVDKDGKPFHFYASSQYEWRTTHAERNLPSLIKLMEIFGDEYKLWLVPGAWNTAYSIDRYAPSVEGAVWLGNFEPVKSKPKIKKQIKKMRDEMLIENLVRN